MSQLTSKEIIKLITGSDEWPITGHMHEQAWPRSNRHSGTDYALPMGTELRAPAPNTEVMSQVYGVTEGGPNYNGNFAYGNNTTIYVPAWDRSYLLAHTQHGESMVDKGQILDEGQLITKSGSTGLSTGPHLHISARKGRHTGSGVLEAPIDFETDIVYLDNESDAEVPSDEGSSQTGVVWIPPHTTLVHRDGTPYEIPTGQNGLYGDVFEVFEGRIGFTASWLQGTDTAYYAGGSVESTSYVGKTVSFSGGTTLYQADGTAYPVKTGNPHTVEIVAQNGSKLQFYASWLQGVDNAWVDSSDLD